MENVGNFEQYYSPNDMVQSRGTPFNDRFDVDESHKAVMTGAGRFETMPGGDRRGRPTAVGNSTMVIGPSVRWREGNIAEQIAGTHNFYLTPEFWRDNVQE